MCHPSAIQDKKMHFLTEKWTKLERGVAENPLRVTMGAFRSVMLACESMTSDTDWNLILVMLCFPALFTLSLSLLFALLDNNSITIAVAEMRCSGRVAVVHIIFCSSPQHCSFLLVR